MPLWPRQTNEICGRSLANTRLWYEKTGIAPILSSGTWTLANRIVYTPIMIPRIHSWQVAICQGSVNSGLFRLGVYADNDGQPGERVFMTNRAAPAVTNDFEFPPGDTIPGIGKNFGGGLYWLAAVFDNTTSAVLRLVALAASGVGPSGAQAGVFYQDMAAFDPLPEEATPLVAINIALNVPVMGVFL